MEDNYMARSRWKFFHINRKFKIFLKNQLFRLKKKNKIIFFDRNVTFLKSLVGSFVFIHKGNNFKSLLLKKNHIGYKTGEFAFTKKPFFFPLNKKKR